MIIHPQKFAVDAGKFIIGIDIHTPTCISNNDNHFIGSITNIHGHMVKVFGGMVRMVSEGKIQ